MSDNTEKIIALFDDYAEQYQNSYMDVSHYSDSFDFFCKNIKPQSAKVLELACGPGNVTQYLLNKRPDLNILATDLAENMLKLAKVNAPEANFKKMDCRAILQLDNQYSGIVAAFCLPYLPKLETEQLIKDASQKLVQGGLLYLSTMENEYLKSGVETNSKGDQLLMYYYTEKILSDMLLKEGFTVLFVDRKVYTLREGKQVTDLLLIAQK